MTGVLFMPEAGRKNAKDLVLAASLMTNLGLTMLWVSWVTTEGPVRAEGPFPYDLPVRDDPSPE